MAEEGAGPNPGAPPPARLASLDAYRGFIMLAMASEGLGVRQVADRMRGNALWEFLDRQLSHVTWTGCSFWDLIQPSFMFMAGVAIPFSYSARRRRGQSSTRIAVHVVWRSLLLVLFGVFLYSNGQRQTNFTFVNVLAQIGLGYSFVYLLRGRGAPVQLGAICVLLGVYWWLFFNHPLPGPDFDFGQVGVPTSWQHLPGWFAHWDKNTNFAADWDVWFLNLLPRDKPFRFNGGGYQTLNFAPSMATMIFGLLAGEVLQSARPPTAKLAHLVLAGAVCLGAGLLMGPSVCPIVKRIWTPSWAVYSAGWTFLMLAAFFWVIDAIGFWRWAFPLVVVGMNSIAMYLMAELLRPWITQTLRTHLGGVALWLGQAVQPAFARGSTWLETVSGINLGSDLFLYTPIFLSGAVLLVLWLICLWLYQRRVFLRI
jgi:predicted acyltransferase